MSGFAPRRIDGRLVKSKKRRIFSKYRTFSLIMKLVRIKSVKPLENFVVYLEFTDGTSRKIDLEPYLRGKIFEPIRQNIDAFRAVKIDERMRTIVWENGADIDPDVLYHELKPAWAENEVVLS